LNFLWKIFVSVGGNKFSEIFKFSLCVDLWQELNKNKIKKRVKSTKHFSADRHQEQLKHTCQLLSSSLCPSLCLWDCLSQGRKGSFTRTLQTTQHTLTCTDKELTFAIFCFAFLIFVYVLWPFAFYSYLHSRSCFKCKWVCLSCCRAALLMRRKISAILQIFLVVLIISSWHL